MDVIKLVEDGVYKKEELNEKARSFIEGMEYVLEEVVNERFFDESDFGDCLSHTLKTIQLEVTKEVVELIRDCIKIEICENIISLTEMGEIDEKSEETDA